MGVPGPVTSAPSAGVHQLIRTRDAVLVTSGEEVLEVVGRRWARYALVRPARAGAARDRLTPRERQVLDAVPLVQAVDVGAGSPARPASRTRRTKEALARLHPAGLVEHSLGRWRLAADPRWTEQETGVAPEPVAPAAARAPPRFVVLTR